MTIHWDVVAIRRHMGHRGWKNARQLAIGAGLTYPAARRILLDRALERIDTRTLVRLGKALHVKPLSLLVTR